MRSQLQRTSGEAFQRSTLFLDNLDDEGFLVILQVRTYLPLLSGAGTLLSTALERFTHRPLRAVTERKPIPVPQV